MGLDISWFVGLSPVTDAEAKAYESGDDEGMTDLFDNPGFPGRACGLSGVYRYTDADHALAIGYGRYTVWRNKLAALAGYPEVSGVLHPHASHVWNVAESGPFYELINFSDCEGTIGAEVCAKLAIDFETFLAPVAAACVYDPDFVKTYNAIHEACKKAADRGALKFH